MTDRSPQLGAYKMFAEGFIEESLDAGVSYFDIPDYAAEEAGKDSDLYRNVKYYIQNPDETELDELIGSKALNEFDDDRELVSEMWDDYESEKGYYLEKYGGSGAEWIREWIKTHDDCPNCGAELFTDQKENQTYCPFCV